MGLDTSHDCWNGPYSAFMRWRSFLHFLLTGEGNGTGTDFAPLELAWLQGRYADPSIPINVLMNHSDCDGRIAAETCSPLADALEALLERMPERAVYDAFRPATKRFIRGLRLAAERGESVEFY